MLTVNVFGWFIIIVLAFWFKHKVEELLDRSWDAFFTEANLYYHDFYWLVNEAVRVGAIDCDELRTIFKMGDVEAAFMRLLDTITQEWEIITYTQNGETRFKLVKKADTSDKH